MEAYSKMRRIIIWLLSQVFATILSHYPEVDKITSIPGQPYVNFQQFAGYITIDESQKKSLFYYFVEAEANPSSKPLVLWLNGGPGCSSVEGAFTENGPFRPNNVGLIQHIYSWNKVANMLYIDSPDGVGFSNSANNPSNRIWRDDAIALQNMLFLLGWFNKFPGYKNRDLFLSGESYAGHYVPQLAQLIIQSPLKPNFKGFLLVNPLLDFKHDTDSMASYMWSHGLISDSSYELLSSTCSMSQIVKEHMTGKSFSPPCLAVTEQLQVQYESYDNKNFTIFDVSRDRCSYVGQNQQQVEGKLDLCIKTEARNYLARKDVQEALHVVGTTNRTSCNENIVKQYAFEDIEKSVIPLVSSLVRSGIRILMISGDQDGKVPFTSTRTIVNYLATNLKLKTTSEYSPWFEGDQIGGWMQIHGPNNLAFATVRGGGHMAPYTSPERSITLFKGFLDGKYTMTSRAKRGL